MKTLSIDTHEHDQDTDSQFYAVLSDKTADVAAPQTYTDTEDEDRNTVGTQPQPDEGVPDRSSGDIDAPWGEQPSPEVVQFSRQAYTDFKQGREKLLEKLLDSKATSDKAEQSMASQYLDHAASGDFETSSPQLSGKSKTSSAAAQRVQYETVGERLRGLIER